MIKGLNPKNVEESKEETLTVSMSEKDKGNFDLFKGLQDKRTQDEVKYQMESRIKHSNWEIKTRGKNIKFKQNQIKNKKVLETMSLRNEKTGITHGFVDGLKPIWFLETEIDLLQMEIDDFKERIRQVNLAREENKNVFKS